MARFLSVLVAALFLMANAGQAQNSFPRIDPKQTPNPAPPVQRQRIEVVKSPDEAYALLSDDKAAMSEWVTAAREIVSSTDTTSNDGYIEEHPIPNSYVPLGESLRSKTNPSVSDLLLKRMWPRGYTDANMSDIYERISLAQALVLWDGKAHLDDLKRFAIYVQTNTREQYVTQLVLKLDEKRIQLGDPSIADDYGTLILSVNHGTDNSEMDISVFRLLWTYPNYQGFPNIIQRIVSTPASPWIPFIKSDRNYQNVALLHSPLIGLPSFRAEIAKEFQDTTYLDNLSSTDGNASINSLIPRDPSASDALSNAQPPPNDVRICDLLALSIAKLEGAPNFTLNLSISERNGAIQRQIAFLNQYGSAYQCENEENSNFLTFHFPQLDQPASPDDVKAGHAIFSLKKYNLPTRIIPLKDGSVLGSTSRDINDPATNTRIDSGTPGRVCQAEAVLANGVWHKFYGVVFKNSLNCLADTDFAASLPKEWFVSGPLQAFLQGSSALPVNRWGATVSSITQSVPIRIVLYNYMAESSPVPASFHIGADPRTMPVRLSLSYTLQLPITDLRRHFFHSRDPRSGGFRNGLSPQATEAPIKDPWTPVPLIPLPATATPEAPSSTPAQTQVLPKGTVILTQFDIRSLFDISRAGYYRFSMGDATPGSTSCVTYEFSVAD